MTKNPNINVILILGMILMIGKVFLVKMSQILTLVMFRSMMVMDLL